MSSLKPDPSRPPRVVIVGGSLGGLFAGTLLLKAGLDVHVYERSAADLDSRGGGIVLQPEVLEVFRRADIDLGTRDLGVRSLNRTVFAPDGAVLRRDRALQSQTSWSMIYSTIRAAFPDERYHQGRRLISIEQPHASEVIAVFDDGERIAADLLIGADGNESKVRSLIWPDEHPTYAGYAAWRGLLSENEMPVSAREALHGDFGFANGPGSHALGYLVPGEGNDTRPGHRLYNWVWYRAVPKTDLTAITTDRFGRSRGFSVPEGALADHWRDHVHDEAVRLLPPPFRDVVRATDAPFIQGIRDFGVGTMVDGRVALMGDAAFIVRPHTAAGTSKAAGDAIALADAFIANGLQPDRALAAFEPARRAVGEAILAQGIRIGDSLLFRKPPLARVG